MGTVDPKTGKWLVGVDDAQRLAEASAQSPFARENAELRSQLATAREERDDAWEEIERLEASLKGAVNRMDEECHAAHEAEARADRLEAALVAASDVFDWIAETWPVVMREIPTEHWQRLMRAQKLIEHGPDDGLSGTATEPPVDRLGSGPAEPEESEPKRCTCAGGLGPGHDQPDPDCPVHGEIKRSQDEAS